MPGDQERTSREDEEERLRNRLQARKEGSKEEARLRERLKAKSDRRNDDLRDSNHHRRHRRDDHDDMDNRRRRNHHHNHRRHDRHPSNDRRPSYYDDRRRRYDERPVRRPSYTDDFGRRCRSRSRSRSYSYSDSSASSRRSRSSSYDSRSSYSSSSSSDQSSNDPREQEDDTPKDQRTVFINQLVMRTTERDIYKYFKSHQIKTNAVILLRDRRTGRHKGCAYAELRQVQDIPKILELSGKAPDFQRFPILIKPSEAEKNYVAAAPAQQQLQQPPQLQLQQTPLRTGVYIPPNAPSVPRTVGPNGQLMEAQRVYVGSLDPSVTPEQLYALFSPLGDISKVALQMDQGISKGFAFLTFTDAKAACLAIQTLAGQVLAGRPLKTGWANHQQTNVQMQQADEFPPDASVRAQKAFTALAQLNMGVLPTSNGGGGNHSAPPAVSAAVAPPPAGTVAEARASLAAAAQTASTAVTTTMNTSVTAPVAVAPSAAPATNQIGIADHPQIGNAGHPTQHLLVHNMYDAAQETDPNWQNDLRDEFKEECSKFGPILALQVLDKEPGGKIYCHFERGAAECAASLNGRWFDQRQLRVEYVSEEQATLYRGKV